jgi:hypothetical protein
MFPALTGRALPGAHGLLEPLGTSLLDLPGQAAGAVGAALDGLQAALTPRSAKADVALVLGPWLRTYGLGTDEPNRIDDAPGFTGRFGETDEQGEAAEANGELRDPASRSGTALIGIEAGLARFLALDLEVITALGRAYLIGSIDVVKGRAEIYADSRSRLPDLEFTQGRLSGDRRIELGLRIGAQALFELIGAHYEVGCDTPPIPMLGRELPLELTARLDAAVHAFARAYAEASVGTRCALMVGGKAFAGASATLAGQAELASMVGAHGSVTAWAGAGAEFTVGVQADFKKHEYGLDHSAGVAAGVGASYDYGVTVHAGEIFAATALPDRLPLIWEQFAGRVERAGRAVLAGESSPGEFGSEVASASGRAIGQLAQSIDDSLP